jgi:cytochrome P450
MDALLLGRAHAADDARPVHCAPDVLRRALRFRLFAVAQRDTQQALQAFCHALYSLAANPQYAEPLREEVEKTIRQYGWTKLGIGKMHKVDSFLKETMRYNVSGCLFPVYIF